jgi:hypothetical protein
MSNKVIYPNRTIEDGPPSIAESLRGIESADVAYRRKLDEMDLKTKEQLRNKKKALEHKLSVAMADIPPIDYTKEEESVLHWEREKSRSIDSIEQSIQYQENQIEQMREAFERKVKTIQERMEMTKRTLADKEAYFIKILFQARQRLELAKCPAESNRVRKLRVELKIIQEDIDKLDDKERKRLGLPPIHRKTEEKVEEEEYNSDGTDVYNEERDGDMEYNGAVKEEAWKQFRTKCGLPIREKK